MNEVESVAGPILLVVQGPILRRVGERDTYYVLDSLNSSAWRNRFRVVFAAWDTEVADDLAAVRSRVDGLLVLKAPHYPGSCNRNLQAHAVHAALHAHRDCEYALKSRSDIVLGDSFLAMAAQFAVDRSDRFLVTNTFTRWEPFHVSDMVTFAPLEWLLDYFYTGPVYYEDLFSPEVQFTRCFIRRRNLRYSATLVGYLGFLRDYVHIVNFDTAEMVWLKKPYSSQAFGRQICADRDIGPVLSSLVRVRQLKVLCMAHGSLLPLLACLMQVADAVARFVMPLAFSFNRYTIVYGKAEHDRPLEDPSTGNESSTSMQLAGSDHDVPAVVGGASESK